MIKRSEGERRRTDANDAQAVYSSVVLRVRPGSDEGLNAELSDRPVEPTVGVSRNKWAHGDADISRRNGRRRSSQLEFGGEGKAQGEGRTGIVDGSGREEGESCKWKRS